MGSARPVFVGVIGVGGVGKAFLSQLQTLSARLAKASRPTTVSLVLVARSNKTLFSESYKPLSFDSWSNDLASSAQPVLDTTELIQFLSTAPGHSILVDNTSNEDLAASYPRFLKAGVSIVTPNKKAFSSTYAAWSDLFAAAANGSGGAKAGYVYHESTVGAGLPVLSSLRDLVDTGDAVTKIEGVFSGTMSFLFNSFMPVGGGGGKFSSEVKKAKELGYTEPDPRDDLNGLDVARKLTILARIVGLDVQSPTAFPVQSLIPKELESAQSGDEFLAGLPQFDDRMESLKAEAAKAGNVVRFVGSIDVKKGEVKVGLEQFDASHPIAALKGSDNIINFYSERYGSNPLIIQGAGAGADVTAMGVTSDLLKVLAHFH